MPIKKVRIRENIGGAVNLKDKNQYVNPRNNYIAVIYKNKDGELEEEMITFWTAVERKSQGMNLYQAGSTRNESKEIFTTLQVNDMFLLGLFTDENNWKKQKLLSEHLYRVQKISESDYNFRHHLATTLDNPNEKIRATSLSRLAELNPIKVQMTRTGQIKNTKHN